ncbi:hypothetical protein L1887_25439 [Cichorium endivia]|nr:hypothetical protein L1887_25439 [Cichorium endivia]
MRSLHERISMEEATIFVLLLVGLQVQGIYTAEIDVISDSRFLTEEDTLVSPTGFFELGFFRPEGSKNKYIGIWYKKISVRTVAWVANRYLPVTGASSGTLKIVSPGNLVLMKDTNDVVWSSNTTSSGNATVQLEDSGNLVVRQGIGKKILWQSFDYPTDTLLPGMMLGRNFLTGKEWHLSSWKSSGDPALGEFTWSVDTRGYPQNLLKQGTSVIKFRGGPWIRDGFSGSYTFKFANDIVMVINETEAAYSIYDTNSPLVLRFALSSSGKIQSSVWVPDAKIWRVVMEFPKDICDTYNICRSYGTCSTSTSRRCACLDETKFVPRDQQGWQREDWEGGCVRRTPLDCENGSDRFSKYSYVKFPDTQTSWFDMTMREQECKEKCLKNCTCMAYAITDVRGEGSGCLLWFNELLDIRVFPEGNQVETVAPTVSPSVSQKGRANIKIILPVVFLGVLLIGLSCTLFWYSWRKKNHAQETRKGESLLVGESQGDALELPLFSFSTIATATDKNVP